MLNNPQVTREEIFDVDTSIFWSVTSRETTVFTLFGTGSLYIKKQTERFGISRVPVPYSFPEDS